MVAHTQPVFSNSSALKDNSDDIFMFSYRQQIISKDQNLQLTDPTNKYHLCIQTSVSHIVLPGDMFLHYDGDNYWQSLSTMAARKKTRLIIIAYNQLFFFNKISENWKDI